VNHRALIADDVFRGARRSALALVFEIYGITSTRDFNLVRVANAATLLPAAPVAATYQPLNDQLEVFIVDANGALNVVWKDNNGGWKQPFPLTGANFTIPGASVASIYYPKVQAARSVRGQQERRVQCRVEERERPMACS
jgi:hypothetical protein